MMNAAIRPRVLFIDAYDLFSNQLVTVIRGTLYIGDEEESRKDGPVQRDPLLV